MAGQLHQQTGPRTRAPESWIQCRGELREARNGLVECPLQGPVQAVECLDCHFLETLSNERSLRTSCQLPDGI